MLTMLRMLARMPDAGCRASLRASQRLSQGSIARHRSGNDDTDDDTDDADDVDDADDADDADDVDNDADDDVCR